MRLTEAIGGLAVCGASLLVAFLVGRASMPAADSHTVAVVEELRKQVDDCGHQNTVLRSQVDQLEDRLADPDN